MKTTHIQTDCNRPYGRQGTFLPVPILTLCLLLATGSGIAQTYTVLHAFTAGPDGHTPVASLLRDNDGNLYGTASGGGAFSYGLVFKMDPHDNSNVLHSFWAGDGLGPASTLIRDEAGTLYGTTDLGGTPEGGRCAFGCGTVFKLDTTGKLTVIYAFTGGTDGALPNARLVRDKDGNLYGVTAEGGNNGACPFSILGTCGVVFRVDTNGKETVLHAFSGTDGWTPSGNLLRDKQGNLYGVTLYGGNLSACSQSGCGTVFKIDAKGRMTTLYSFPGGSGGEYPEGSLAHDSLGNLYGTASGEPFGADCCGLVFKLDKAGKGVVVYAFQGNPDGSYPVGGVTRDKTGKLYGTTYAGGTGNCSSEPGCGTIFMIDVNGKETVLYSLSGGSDGFEPEDALIMDHAGNLYGTASYGGDLSCGFYTGCGVVFKLTP